MKTKTEEKRITLSKILKMFKRDNPDLATTVIYDAIRENKIPHFRSSTRKRSWIKLYPSDVKRWLADYLPKLKN